MHEDVDIAGDGIYGIVYIAFGIYDCTLAEIKKINYVEPFYFRRCVTYTNLAMYNGIYISVLVIPLHIMTIVVDHAVYFAKVLSQ